LRSCEFHPNGILWSHFCSSTIVSLNLHLEHPNICIRWHWLHQFLSFPYSRFTSWEKIPISRAPNCLFDDKLLVANVQFNFCSTNTHTHSWQHSCYLIANEMKMEINNRSNVTINKNKQYLEIIFSKYIFISSFTIKMYISIDR